MILLLISLIFLFIYAGLIFYYRKGWKLTPDFISANSLDNRFISVLIAARNEENNIVPLLNALNSQTYSRDHFEIIVVDDYSSDKTGQKVKDFPMKNLRLIQPYGQPDQSSKKKAITTGISLAKGELIVTTDADCIPGPEWLVHLNRFYVQTGACFIAAPVKYKIDESILQKFQAIDFMTLQGITAASVTRNFHAMCNGANLAYRKEAFHAVNGFEGIDRVATGDDMLLMYKIWKQYPSKVFYLKNPEVIVTTAPMLTWKSFFSQRKRWASKTLVYDDQRVKAVLFFVYLFNLLFPVLLIAAFFDLRNLWYAAGFWILKTLIELPFIYDIARFYKEEKLLRNFFFFQPLHMIYTVYVGLISQYGKYEWKGRKTK